MSVAAMFTAIFIASGWALAMVPNIEVVTAVAFVSGVTLGARTGMLIGAGGMFLFSATNPVGSGLAFPLLLVSQIVAMAVVGASGGIFFSVSLKKLHSTAGRLTLAVTGLAVTLLYDGLTSISFPLFSGAGRAEIIAVLVAGLVFTLVHQISNTLIFFLLVPRLIEIGRGRVNPGAPTESGQQHQEP